MNKLYFTFDWHIGHKNILAYDSRPFDDLAHMHRVLINNYTLTVGADDTCYFLGDMGMCKIEIMEPIIKSLFGTKILILGNHDKGRAAMEKCGFATVMNGAILEIAGKAVTLTYCPLLNVWREDVAHMKNS